MNTALLEALGLKSTDRAGWVRRDIEHPESVAAHSWGVAFLVLLFLPKELNRERALTYAILHDLAEAWTGDFTPQDPIPDKHALEDAAIAAFCSRIKRTDLLEMWRAYEAQADPESRFVKQLDRLDMGLQAQIYGRNGLDLSEFRDSALTAIDSAMLRELLD